MAPDVYEVTAGDLAVATQEIEMAQFMLLLHQAPNYNEDLPREKVTEITKRYICLLYTSDAADE